MELIEKLQALGLNESESKLYINALELGTFSVTQISEKSGFKRPTCYLILDELTKRGLVSIVPYSSKLTYSAESPEVFLSTAEKNVLDIRKILPDLFEIQEKSKNRPIIKFYPGQKGARTVYKDVLKEKPKEYNYIGNILETLSVVGEEFLQDWANRRIRRKIYSKGIGIDAEYTNNIFNEEDEALRETRYAPDGTVLPYTILLYGNKVGIISTRKDGFGLIIESSDFRITMRSLFDVLWEASKPFSAKKKKSLPKN